MIANVILYWDQLIAIKIVSRDICRPSFVVSASRAKMQGFKSLVWYGRFNILSRPAEKKTKKGKVKLPTQSILYIVMGELIKWRLLTRQTVNFANYWLDHLLSLTDSFEDFSFDRQKLGCQAVMEQADCPYWYRFDDWKKCGQNLPSLSVKSSKRKRKIVSEILEKRKQSKHEGIK